MFNLSDALGRPLFSNIQVCAIFTRVPLACLSDAPCLTPEDQFSLRCMPEDRRARKVRWQTCARMSPSSPPPRCPSVRAGAHTSWRRCRVGCRPTRWRSSRASLQMIRPCCSASPWALPPTARTRPSRRIWWMHSSTARGSETSIANSSSSIPTTPMCAQFPAFACALF